MVSVSRSSRVPTKEEVVFQSESGSGERQMSSFQGR